MKKKGYHILRISRNFIGLNFVDLPIYEERFEDDEDENGIVESIILKRDDGEVKITLKKGGERIYKNIDRCRISHGKKPGIVKEIPIEVEMGLFGNNRWELGVYNKGGPYCGEYFDTYNNAQTETVG